MLGSTANCRFSKTTMFPSNEAALNVLVCWAVIIQENRQSWVRIGFPKASCCVSPRSGSTGLNCPETVVDWAAPWGQILLAVVPCQTMSSCETKIHGTWVAAGMTENVVPSALV